MNKSAKLLIAAAGTGGHVMPALAVAELVSKEKFQVHWAGTEHGLEKRLLSDHTFPFHCFKVSSPPAN
jgi:UDP-N-acetylglucosamine--N-acetylmuramyl-(pentapeptide) pyrophosphoryl-undecaprenol N-acetylglucosamine transferase